MGLLSSKKSRTAYTTNNVDESINLADSTLMQVADGGLLAEEIGSYKRDSENINVVGSSNIVEQFSDNAAAVVRDALVLSESLTSKNLQLQTDKDLLKMEVAKEKGITAADVKQLMQSKEAKFVAGIAAALIAWAIWKKARA